MTGAETGVETASGGGAGSTRRIGGRYSLEREIGRGGMGSVWRGHDHVLGRVVALKKAGMAPGEDSPDAARARREASLAARLDDPHVVAVLDLVQDRDEQWLVMEYVEGTNLAELVAANGTLAPDDLAPILAQVARALAAAHAQGIVHRDVKPSNILVTPDGHAKLTDFGIARAEADPSLTRTGLVTGSPAYLAPEVASGASATPASDLWSLGATVVHAVTGGPPYPTKENVLAALYKIVHEDPPRPPEAGWLAPLVASTLVHEPDRRWDAATARAFLEAGPPGRGTKTGETRVLPAATRTLPAAPPPPPPPATTAHPGPAGVREGERRRPALVAAGAVLVVLLLGGLVLGLTRDDGEEPTATARSKSEGAAPSAGGDPSPTQSAQPKPPRPTAAGMERFVAEYLRTVVRSPQEAFAMLTPEFQQQSGGLEGYTGFWGDVAETELEDVSADPRSMTVTYEYTYTTESGQDVEDTVQLVLAYERGKYLIAAEPG